MKKILLLFFLVCAGACTRQSAVIEGTLSSDKFDNEWVYWVPFEGVTSKTVDSTLIQKNMFRLVVSEHNLNKAGIIRVRPVLRIALQDILVVTETGTVHVHLDSLSRATGTPLNDVLQYWKDLKYTYDKEVYVMRKALGAADENDKTEIQEEFEILSAAYREDIYQVVAENKDNMVGKLIFSLQKTIFTPEQIEELAIENEK